MFFLATNSANYHEFFLWVVLVVRSAELSGGQGVAQSNSLWFSILFLLLTFALFAKQTNH